MNSGARRCLLSHVFFVISHAPLVFTLLLWLYPLRPLSSKVSWGTDYLSSPSAAQGSCGGTLGSSCVKIHKPVIAPLPHITRCILFSATYYWESSMAAVVSLISISFQELRNNRIFREIQGPEELPASCYQSTWFQANNNVSHSLSRNKALIKALFVWCPQCCLVWQLLWGDALCC